MSRSPPVEARRGHHSLLTDILFPPSAIQSAALPPPRELQPFLSPPTLSLPLSFSEGWNRHLVKTAASGRGKGVARIRGVPISGAIHYFSPQTPHHKGPPRGRIQDLATGGGTHFGGGRSTISRLRPQITRVPPYVLLATPGFRGGRAPLYPPPGPPYYFWVPPDFAPPPAPQATPLARGKWNAPSETASDRGH